jgi:hypothetical protein
MTKTEKKMVEKQAKKALRIAELKELPSEEISDALAEMQVKASLKMRPGSSAEGRDALNNISETRVPCWRVRAAACGLARGCRADLLL